MGLWGLVSPKSVEQAHRLEVQVRADVAILSPKSAGRASWLETQVGGVPCCSLEAEFLLWEICFCF